MVGKFLPSLREPSGAEPSGAKRREGPHPYGTGVCGWLGSLPPRRVPYSYSYSKSYSYSYSYSKSYSYSVGRGGGKYIFLIFN